jgi:hypothetical protein
MERFNSATSFGYEVSKRYDAHPRGDEAETHYPAMDPEVSPHHALTV